MKFTISSYTQEKIVSEIDEVIDWGVSILGAPQAWQVTKGKGVKVAILDTGIDATHPDLRGNIRGGMNFTSDDPTDFMDKQGHGTHCAGIIAGIDNGIGIIGVAPEASIYAVKVLDNHGAGKLTGIIRGLRWAIDQDMDVISMSLGVGKEPPQIIHNLFKEAYRKGIPIVVASGNEGKEVAYPAAYPESIAVGAINETLQASSFSNRGKGLDIVAPGVGIYSTYLNGQYSKMSGTSMAAPLVAGAIALWIANRRKLGKSYTVADIHYALAKSAKDIGPEGYDEETGYGLLDIVRFLDM